MQKSMTELWFI